jgi:hypothetical protein
MSDNLFGDLDVESAEDNPWIKPDGTYHCYLTKVSVGLTKNQDKRGMNLEYTIVEGPKKTRKIKEWKWVPSSAQVKGYDSLEPLSQLNIDGMVSDEDLAEKAANAVSYLKARLKDFGIPSDKMNSIQSQDLMDLELDLNITIRNKNGNENIVNIALYEGESSSDPFGG